MVVPSLGFGLGVLLAVGIGTVAAALARWLGYSKRQRDQVFAITALVMALPLVMPTMGGMIWLCTQEKIGVNQPEADRIIARWKVPPGAASDLCYFRTPRFSEYFDFQISEADFLKWMQTRGWGPQRYTFQNETDKTQWTFDGRPEYVDCDVEPRRNRDRYEPRYVLDGYCYHERYAERAECSFTIIYDVKEGRAYVEAPN